MRPTVHSAAMLAPGAPFVLLDDARPNGARILYSDPQAIVVAHRPEDVKVALAHLRTAVSQGSHAAGWLAYEAGHALEPTDAQW